MILEGIVTTHNDDGTVNVAPMGPIVEPDMGQLHLRPFQTSTTYRNLKRTGEGVLHVTDDVLLFARAALRRVTDIDETQSACIVTGTVLSRACRWYEFRVTTIDDSQERTSIHAEVVHAGRLRDFFGFNRAKHAVLEAAILATRLHLLPITDVQQRLAALAEPVEKTAGEAERQAFAEILDFVAEYQRDHS